MNHLVSISSVYRRMALVWIRTWYTTISFYVFDPLLFLFALGFGLGAAFDTMAGLPYFEFVVPGMMVSASLFATIFDGCWGSYFRVHSQGTWKAQLATTVSLWNIRVGEQLWGSTKALMASSAVLSAGWVFGGVQNLEFGLLAVPLVALFAMVFQSMGQAFASHIKTMSTLELMSPILVSPMFLFCGVFIDIGLFPTWIQWVATIYPMYHMLEVIRPLMTGTLGASEFLFHVAALMGFWILFNLIAQRGFRKILLN